MSNLFDANIYIERRKALAQQVGSGVIILPGNNDSPMNYGDNIYPFRQDSTFRYYFGLDMPNLVGIIDIENGREMIFGDDPSVETIVWIGSQIPLQEKCQSIGIQECLPHNKISSILANITANGRPTHFLPQYRADITIMLSQYFGVEVSKIADNVSETLIKAVVDQRSIKSDLEVTCIESALDICHDMHVAAMKHARPGMYEREVVGITESIPRSRGVQLSFPTIFTINGQTLHNLEYNNKMQAGDIVIHDSGSEDPMGYAGDITRTIPVGGKFDSFQKDIYNIVLDSQMKAIEAIKPGIEFREIYWLASRILVDGLKDLGLMQGDTNEAVAAGAHALFFPCGLGHMIGLDVHDMQGLGENYVGYTEKLKRSEQFGLRSLRLARALEPGFVVTVEPGIYFIPELIDQWQSGKKHLNFINYSNVAKYRSFGGVRIEDVVLVTSDSYRVLGRPIPKSIADVQKICCS
ncbi:MAG: aminopeptidase P family protein [Phycisphaerae bacterium]|nr:aminopeptidase P family protein [Phycisphaerae bacterium]